MEYKVQEDAEDFDQCRLLSILKGIKQILCRTAGITTFKYFMLTQGMCELSLSKTYQRGHYTHDSMTVIMGMTAFLLSIVATAGEILKVWNCLIRVG